MEREYMFDPPISRRDLLRRSATAFTSLAVPALVHSRAPVEPTQPIELSPGVHLLLDDYLIASQTGLKRVINQPARLAQPLVTGKEDGNFQPYLSVLRDPISKRFRMWYD